MKFEYEGIIKKKKDKRTWQVSLCVSLSVENMESGWPVSCGPLLDLMGRARSPAGTCLQGQPQTLPCWDHCQGRISAVVDVGATCLTVWGTGVQDTAQR